MRYRLFRLFMQPMINRTAKSVWGKTGAAHSHDFSEILDGNFDFILDSTWKRYAALAPKLQDPSGIRIWFVMQLACLTLSSFQILRDSGVDQEAAIALIYELSWEITSQITRFSDRISRLFFRSPMRRLEFLVDLVMKVIFYKPAYQTEKASIAGGFSMDVLSCPVAAYMAGNQASELCVGAWCSVDGGLVEIIGGRLERSGTIAMGHEYCDFKFYIDRT